MTKRKDGEDALLKRISPKIDADKAWYLALLDEPAQRQYEADRLAAVLLALKRIYLSRYRRRIAELREEIARIGQAEDLPAEEYRSILEKREEIRIQSAKMDTYKCFFTEPYFARMDVVDDEEGYNSYYIGKKGDVNLEIVDWRAPLAVRYYQKSRVNFTINQYNYRTVLRRALSVKNGALLDFRNEYLSVKDVLSSEEIAGRDEEILFDPYLRSIIEDRKGDVRVRDIITTIQEQQFEIINRPERENFILQGCAGSGKTMILLHRLSYLMYNYEQVKPRDVLVITPSDSFNAFIDELAKTLEIGKVKTVTLKRYFFRVLEGQGIDLAPKCTEKRESEAYLAYLYSERFRNDVKRKIKRLTSDMVGLFSADECREVAEDLLRDCALRREKYAAVKNASTRIRRAVLGEMKEAKGGGFYFTKPFRAVMSDFTQIEDFLTYLLREPARTPDYFFRRFREFYRALRHAAAHADSVFAEADGGLDALAETVRKEIFDLKRYRLRRGGEEVFTYADRIAYREELLGEIEKIRTVVAGMREGLALLGEFSSVLRATGECARLGKCTSDPDVIRWLYRATVKKFKEKYGLEGVYPSDGYALCYVLAEAGRTLTPRYGHVFVDEGQDLSAGEYELLLRINGDAAFNIFGDLKQNITPWRGIGSWEALGFPVYTLERNYRNTNEIVEFVSGVLDARMLPIGLHGEKVHSVGMRGLAAFFREKTGLKAVICREEDLPLFAKRGYRRPSADGSLSPTHINVLTVYESKGLEFSAVAVCDRGMSENERYIAYTRALAYLVTLEV